MAALDTALKDAMSIEGAIGVALVDYSSGMTLGIAGGSPELDLGMAAAGNTDVVRAKMRTLEMLKIEDSIEDILITLDTQYHLIRPLGSRAGKGLFIYLALNKSRANLGLARHQLLIHDLHGGPEPHDIAALAAATFGLGRQTGLALRQGPFRESTVRSHRGYFSVYAVGDSALLAVLGGEGLNIARLHLEARQVTARLITMLEVHVAAQFRL